MLEGLKNAKSEVKPLTAKQFNKFVKDMKKYNPPLKTTIPEFVCYMCGIDLNDHCKRIRSSK